MATAKEDSIPVLLNSVQMRLSSSQRQLSIVRAQMSNRIREAKMQELTIEQLKGLGNETRVYKAVGKMFMREDFDDVLAEAYRKRDQAMEETQMLEKKSSFYEKEATEAKSHLTDLVKSIEKASTPP
ncbi:prefoldin subunit 1 [Malassezia pachydermatis]|uniref:Prefoldin subunit 1 n=1 Tax=Malassezia pachydermatis TaxID=77020 RepID=A0A0M8MXB8_9BASI|nr:prefoldin subunit 1 [Malassezia pachydermatis]KOS16204.1 prefoldin subunit 1 [Malassezia pachydermatis]